MLVGCAAKYGGANSTVVPILDYKLRLRQIKRAARAAYNIKIISFFLKGDIGMANYEKQVEQEAAYPIPISLYNCYRTVRHEKSGIYSYS